MYRSNALTKAGLVLNADEHMGFQFATRIGTGYVDEQRSDRFAGGACVLAMIGLLAGFAMIVVAIFNEWVALIPAVVFALLMLAALALYLISRQAQERRTYLFTNQRLIILSNKADVKPRSITYQAITRIAVHVPDDDDPRPQAVRFAEYTHGFNQIGSWPKPYGVSERVLMYRPPSTGKIRLYASGKLEVEIPCLNTLIKRVRLIRSLLGREVEVE